MSIKKEKKAKEKTKQMPDLDLTEHLNSTNFASVNQKKFYESIVKNHISLGIGQAGVGKTFLSL
jgi:phosphate starvation-inducible protein PhoH